MVDIENSVELLKYINNETKTTISFNYFKLYSCYSTCLLKTFICLGKKLDDNTKIIAGINVIHHVFWIIINYTKNLNVAIILSERSILLFTEFLIMSNDPSVNKDLYFTPTITDAIKFAYKKTIGPISLKNIPQNNKLVNNVLLLLKSITSSIYNKINIGVNDSENAFHIYFKFIEKCLYKTHHIINNNNYFPIIYENFTNLLTIENELIEVLFKLKLLNEYIFLIKEKDAFTFEKLVTNYFIYLSINDISNVELTISNLDMNIKKVDLYKKIA